MALEKKAYNHEYSGSCGPNGATYFDNSSFSVGCFQWLPTASGKGLKKSAVKLRVKGFSSDPEKVYSVAEQVCKHLDDGWVPDTKSKTV